MNRQQARTGIMALSLMSVGAGITMIAVGQWIRRKFQRNRDAGLCSCGETFIPRDCACSECEQDQHDKNCTCDECEPPVPFGASVEDAYRAQVSLSAKYGFRPTEAR